MNSSELEIVLLAVAAVPATALLARVFARASWAPIDFPNQRSLHSTPKPRVGGLAGGMAAIGFAVVAVEAFAVNVSHVGIIAVLIAASAAGFLLVNFPPARVFLGDAGSAPIGFLAAAASVQLASTGGVPLLQPVLAFAPFVLDATITILRRILAGSAFWRPHREHCYQRLIRRGWTHRRTVFTYYGLMLMSGTASLLYGLSPFGAVLAVVGAHCLLLLAATWAGRGPPGGIQI